MSSEHSETSERSSDRGSFESLTVNENIQYSTYPGIRIRRGGKWIKGGEEFLSSSEAQILIDSFSLGNWLCGVTIIRNAQGIETQTSYPLVQLLENSQLCDLFVVIGENSNNGVHHSHFIVKTTSRVDAFKRSLLNAQTKSDYCFDVCKLASCRFWLGMFCYMLKNPLIVFASTTQLGNLAYYLIETGHTLKYIKKEPKSKEIVSIINTIIEENACDSVEKIYLKGGDKLLPYLHLSTLESIMKNCIAFYQASKQNWDPWSFKYHQDQDPRAIHNILKYQKINIFYWDSFFWKWLTRTNGKKNTIILLGPSNTGKTTFIRGLIELLNGGSIVNTSSPFFAEGICGKIIARWEEPLLMQEQADIFKIIAEGSPIELPQKFKKPYYHQGCPLIITTNHEITRFCSSEETAINNRCETFYWMSAISSSRRICENNCISHCSAERCSTPCYLNWSPSLGNPPGEPTPGSSRYSWTGCSEIFRCSRWWCGFNNGKPCRSCSRPEEQRTVSRRYDLCSSTSTSGNNGSSGKHKTGSSGDGVPSRIPKLFLRSFGESRFSSERIPRTNEPWGNGMGFSRTRGASGQNRESNPERASLLSGRGRGSADKTIENTEKTSPGNVCSCLIEPTKQDWQSYIAYLANKYAN